MSLKLPKFKKWHGNIWSWEEGDNKSYANGYFFEAYCGYDWWLAVYVMKYVHFIDIDRVWLQFYTAHSEDSKNDR